jgi:hypothetical protein
MKKRIAVLVSGGGTNLQALLDAEAAGKIPHGEIALVISNNPDAYALERAKKFGVPGAVITRSKMEDLSKMELRAFAIGDVGFVVAPYEMFGYHGQLIKEQSPYAMTFISTLGEGDIGYLPTLEAAEYACYESEVSIFERGTGDKAADEFIAMLNGLKNS